MLIKGLSCLFCGMILGATLKAQERIILHYNERVPYLMGQPSGQVSGLTADPANQAFEKARIPFHWIETPPKRQLYLLQQNRGNDCLVGWFKNAEREKFAQYTAPIYQDKPTLALARADHEQIQSGTSLKDLISHSKLSVIVKDGYSYGAYIDQLLAQYQPDRIVTSGENLSMLEMLYKKHGDYFFIAEEEAVSLIASVGFPPSAFKYIRFPDMPEGEKRYILCSRKVGEEIIKQLNAAILALELLKGKKDAPITLK